MPKEAKIIIERCNLKGFSYGNCATYAISQVFNEYDKDVVDHFKSIGANPNKGVTTIECRKIINRLALYNRKTSKYYSRGSLKRILRKKGHFLLNYDNHLSYVKDGVFYDDFFWFNGYGEGWAKARKLAKKPILGYWEIKNI